VDKRAAIKLVVANPATAESQLVAMGVCLANFPHPHLIQLLDAGSCDVADADDDLRGDGICTGRTYRRFSPNARLPRKKPSDMLESGARCSRLSSQQGVLSLGHLKAIEHSRDRRLA
jgi:hypothetical protein